MTLTGRMVVLVRVDVRGHELPFARERDRFVTI